MNKQETLQKRKAYVVTLKNGIVIELKAAGFAVDKDRISFYAAFWRVGNNVWEGASPLYEFRKSEVVCLRREFLNQGDNMEFGADELFND